MTAHMTTGYNATTAIETDPRRAEAALLSRLAAQMLRCEDLGIQAFPMLAKAVHENRKFWHLAAADLAGDGNGLPEALRAQLISIAGFVDRESARVLSRTKSAEALIEINRSIARGLFAAGV